MSTRDQVRRPIVDNSSSAAKLESCPRWAPPEVQVETWECRVVVSRLAVSETVLLAGGCELMVHKPSPERFPEPPRPGEHLRMALGWTPLLRTQNSGGWVFRYALRGKQLLAALVSSVNWVARCTYRTAWAVSPRCCCSYAYGLEVLGRKLESALGVAPKFVEGRCTSDGALVC